MLQVEAIRIARAIEIEEGERNKTAIKSQASKNIMVEQNLILKFSWTYIDFFDTFNR